MQEQLDLSLPERRRPKPITGRLTIALLLLLVVLVAFDLFMDLRPDESGPQLLRRGLSAEQTRRLAGKLAQRSLYRQAAETWQDYASSAGLSDSERAKALFQAGAALEKGGLYAEAIEYYYRSETVAALEELSGQINTHLKACFEKLGKFAALRYELMDRTSIAKTEAGGEVVAEIGAEKITLSGLDALIESSIENQLVPMAAFMTAEQLNQQKKKMLERYQTAEAKRRFLEGYIAQEILYRQALEEQLAEDPKVKGMLNELARNVLSQQLMNRQLASKIHITDSDLQTYYAANKDKYIEPARATISHILVSDEQQAKDLIEQLKAGGDFGKLARKHSLDEKTKEGGGKIEAELVPGPYVPVIGDVNGLNELIFKTEEQTVLDQPVKTEKGWEVIRVDTKIPERQMAFDEVRGQVLAALTDQKRQDVQQEYIKQMMDKYDVIIHGSVLAPSKAAGADGGSADSQK